MKLSLYSAMAVAMIFVSSTTNAIALKDETFDGNTSLSLGQTDAEADRDFLNDFKECLGRKTFYRPTRIIRKKRQEWEALQKKKAMARQIRAQNE